MKQVLSSHILENEDNNIAFMKLGFPVGNIEFNEKHGSFKLAFSFLLKKDADLFGYLDNICTFASNVTVALMLIKTYFLTTNGMLNSALCFYWFH